MPSAPGVNVNVLAGASSPQSNTPTATWFVVGDAYGPSGFAVPVNSISDFNKYFGQIVNGQITGRYTLTADSTTINSSLLYDALDLYFREGGINAFVSLRAPASGGAAATITSGLTVLTALGKGEWANSSSASAAGVIVTVTCPSTGVWYATIAYNGVTLATSPSLGSDADLQTWINSLPAYNAMVVASGTTGSTTLPTAGNSLVIYLAGGTNAAVADSDIDAALAVFNAGYGPGQVSFPGHVTDLCNNKLTAHAALYNRVAFLDGANTATVSTLTASVATLQGAPVSGGVIVDPSYAAFFAPWVSIPGLVNTNPSSASGVVANRIAAPSAFAAAKVAIMDQTTDCNVPAAGRNGSASYAVGVTQAWTDSQRATLNPGGVNVIRVVPNLNAIELYGFRSAAFDQNWVFLNNVRFRMQMIRDFDIVAEGFVFAEIDGRGQVFSRLNGALAGVCQGYYNRGSLYGLVAQNAFSVNTGPQVNNPTTIAASQINALVSLRMSPSAEFVNITVSKFLASSALPVTA